MSRGCASPRASDVTPCMSAQRLVRPGAVPRSKACGTHGPERDRQEVKTRSSDSAQFVSLEARQMYQHFLPQIPHSSITEAIPVNA